MEFVSDYRMINKANSYRWRILTLLFFATTINYIDRQIIGILKPFIADDLGWGEADYGYIVTAFQIAYAIGLAMGIYYHRCAGIYLGRFLAGLSSFALQCIVINKTRYQSLFTMIIKYYSIY